MSKLLTFLFAGALLCAAGCKHGNTGEAAQMPTTTTAEEVDGGMPDGEYPEPATVP